jgi:hypothetical protein
MLIYAVCASAVYFFRVKHGLFAMGFVCLLLLRPDWIGFSDPKATFTLRILRRRAHSHCTMEFYLYREHFCKEFLSVPE